MEPLSSVQQDALLLIHENMFGPNISRALVSYSRGYNQETMALTEDLLDELRECNGRVQALLISLAGAAALATKGWLRKVLEKLAEELGRSGYTLKFSGCRNHVASYWVREIQMSAVGALIR